MPIDFFTRMTSIFNEERIIYFTNSDRITGSTVHLDTKFIPYTNLKTKHIIDINVRLKSVQLLEENFFDLELGIGFVNITPKVQVKTKGVKWT